MSASLLRDDDPPADDLTRSDGVKAKLDEVLELLRQQSGGRATASREKFWALEGLRQRVDDPSGGVLLTGSVTMPNGVPYEWQQGEITAKLLDTTWATSAQTLDALAHPVRLRLLEEVARGVNTTAQLAALEGLGTSGQLHHHLRQLVAAGWLRSTNRGVYDIPAQRVVPLLVVLLAVQQ